MTRILVNYTAKCIYVNQKYFQRNEKKKKHLPWQKGKNFHVSEKKEAEVEFSTLGSGTERKFPSLPAF